MKHLYLIRHAKSSWKDLSLDDFDRPLNKRGKHNAKLMSKVLKEKSITPDAILSSPAKRAKAMALALADALEFDRKRIDWQEKIYEASVNDLQQVVSQASDNCNTLFLVGHNPSLNMFLDYLVPAHPVDNIVTAAMVHVVFNIESWKDLKANSGKLMEHDFPKRHYTP